MARKAKAAVIGIGHSKVYRRDEVPLIRLVVEACRNAVADAGLKLSDIDGIVTNPDQPFEGGGAVDGIDLITPLLAARALSLETRWAQNVVGSTVGKSLVHGINAVAAGACETAIVFKALSSPAGRYGHTDPKGIEGPGKSGMNGPFVGIYGVTPVANVANLATRYMHLHGGTREQLGTFVCANRDVALLWDWGYWKQHKAERLSMEQYLAARWVAEPFGIHDCDIPVQGVGAMVVTNAERARHAPHRAWVLSAVSPRPVIDNRPWVLETMMAEARRFGRILFERAGITPADVNVANLYDGFSIFPALWLDALGLCDEGAGLETVASARSRLDGALPINTSSGNLGSGRMHGMSHLLDAALQAMGRSGPRQAKRADISIAVVGPQSDGAGIVFSRDAH